MVLPYLKLQHDLDDDVLVVLEATLRRYLRQLPQMRAHRATSQTQDAFPGLLNRIRKHGRDGDVELLQLYADLLGMGRAITNSGV